eukprot:5399985-Prymnesium_polylepis.1
MQSRRMRRVVELDVAIRRAAANCAAEDHDAVKHKHQCRLENIAELAVVWQVHGSQLWAQGEDNLGLEPLAHDIAMVAARVKAQGLMRVGHDIPECVGQHELRDHSLSRSPRHVADAELMQQKQQHAGHCLHTGYSSHKPSGPVLRRRRHRPKRRVVDCVVNSLGDRAACRGARRWARGARRWARGAR